MPKSTKGPIDRPDGIAYTINGVPVKFWGKLKLICFQRKINLRQGLLMAIEEFIIAHNDDLNEALGIINNGEADAGPLGQDGGGESDIQPGE